MLVGWITGPNYWSHPCMMASGRTKCIYHWHLILILPRSFQSLECKLLKGRRLVPEIFSGGLWSQNDFHNNTKTLLALFTDLTFSLIVQRQQGAKLLMPPNIKQGRATELYQESSCSSQPCTQQKKMPVSPQISLMSQETELLVLNLDAWVNIFLIGCVREGEVNRKHLCCTPGVGVIFRTSTGPT